MNILITRPLIDAEDLMGKFFSLGHKIIHIPTLKISSVKTKPVDPSMYNAFIFTSANAIRNLQVINQDKNKLCFCVGSITEKIARMSGYNNTVSAGGTVNALKNLIINSNQINEKSHDTGEGKAFIISAFFSVGNDPKKTFSGGEYVDLNYLITVNDIISGLLVGFSIKDKLGQKIIDH